MKIVITPRQILHIFIENAPLSTKNEGMLNELAGVQMEIEAIDIVPSNCGFNESDIVAAQNCNLVTLVALPNV